MTLIGILIALAVERLLSYVRQWREHHWFDEYVHWLHGLPGLGRLWCTPWGAALLLGPPVFVVALVQLSLSGGVLNLLWLVFAVVILIFCLGPRDLWEEVHAYLQAAEDEDDERLQRIADDLCAGPNGYDPGTGRGLINAVMVQAHERIFGILIWFFVLGPAGAVLYRLAASLPEALDEIACDHSLKQGADRFHAILAWAPARLTVLLYLLAGSADDALKEWRRLRSQSPRNTFDATWQVLAAVGVGALQMEEGEDNHRVDMSLEEKLRHALSTISRALLILLALLSLLTVGDLIL